MKKILIGAAIALAVTSCGAILEALVTDPLFNLPETMYDGQIFRITRLGSCFYEWRLGESVSSDNAVLTYLDEKGNPVSDIEKSEKGNVRLSVKLKNDQPYKTVTVYASNHEDETVAEQEKQTDVCQWVLAAYGPDLTEAKTGAVTYTPGETIYIGMSKIDASNFKPAKNGRVVGEDEKSSGAGIQIGFKDSKNQYTGLKWEISGVDASKYDVEKLHTLLKLTPKAGCTGNITIKATLGYGEDLEGEVQNKIGAVSHSITIGS